jgi:hypothetical protein
MNGSFIMKADDRVSGFLLMILGGATCLEATRYRIGSMTTPGAGFFPLLLGLFVVSLSFALFMKSFSPPKDPRPSESLWMVLTRKKVWYIVLALIVYGLLLDRLGFLLTTFAVFTFILRAVEPQKWWLCILGGVAASVGCYVLFYLALGVQLPHGILGP